VRPAVRRSGPRSFDPSAEALVSSRESVGRSAETKSTELTACGPLLPALFNRAISLLGGD
jgi:hypothetical protein